MKYKFRNTYQVPAGKVVVVDTPQGQHKYTGGQYVPPEQLQNARTEEAGGKSAPPGAPQETGWEEIVQQFKNVDIGNTILLNKASYNIKQFLPFQIEYSSNKIHPACRFGAELTLANIVNSLPGLKDLGQVQVFIFHPNDITSSDTVLGKTFIKVGEVSYKENLIKYIQSGKQPVRILEKTAKFIGNKFGVFVFRNIYAQVEQYKANEKQIDAQIQQLQSVLKNLLSQKKAEDDVNQMMAQLQQLVQQKELMSQLIPGLATLEKYVKQEGALNPSIGELLKKDTKQGTIEQFAAILSHANAMSLGLAMTFDGALESLAGTHPNTMAQIKLILSILAPKQEEQPQ